MTRLNPKLFSGKLGRVNTIFWKIKMTVIPGKF